MKNQKNKQMNDKWQMKNDKYKPFLLILKCLIGIIIFFLLLVLISSPLRGKAANSYVKRGDNLLLQKKYVSAEVEYTKALTLNTGNIVAKDHMDLAKKAAINIGEFERFFDLPQFADFKAKYEIAITVPTNQSDAVKTSKNLIEDGEYQLAIIPAKTALEMDNGYRDAWLYFGIANLKTAQLAELKSEDQNEYLVKAKESFDRVLQLDPGNKTAKELLSKI